MTAESGTGPAVRPGGQDQKDSTPAIVQHRVIPEAFRADGAMADPDYTDFTAMACGAGDRSPEQWARAAFQDIFSSRQGRFILRGLLRLRLERRASPDDLAGWKIADRADRWLRLEASSWLLTTHLVVRADDEQVSVATLIRYHHPLASLIWPPMSALGHRRFMPGLLRDAHQALRSTRHRS
jgi:hypothetical protein